MELTQCSACSWCQWCANDSELKFALAIRTLRWRFREWWASRPSHLHLITTALQDAAARADTAMASWCFNNTHSSLSSGIDPSMDPHQWHPISTVYSLVSYPCFVRTYHCHSPQIHVLIPQQGPGSVLPDLRAEMSQCSKRIWTMYRDKVHLSRSEQWVTPVPCGKGFKGSIRIRAFPRPTVPRFWTWGVWVLPDAWGSLDVPEAWPGCCESDIKCWTNIGSSTAFNSAR